MQASEAAWFEQRVFNNLAYDTLVRANHSLAPCVSLQILSVADSLLFAESSSASWKRCRLANRTLLSKARLLPSFATHICCLAGYSRVSNMSAEFSCSGLTLAFDGTTGAITRFA